MLTLSPSSERLELLCLGAHSDDIEIGCGGTVLQLAKRYQLSVTWVVFSGDDKRQREASASAAAFLENVSEQRVLTYAFEDALFPQQRRELKATFEQLREASAPDLIFTHAQGDRHQDHRLLAELSWNCFRDHAILEYEIPKYDGDLGQPNTFVPLEDEVAAHKLELLAQHFASQQSKPWYDRETFSGLMRLRGLECRAESRWAEAFYGRKLRLG